MRPVEPYACVPVALLKVALTANALRIWIALSRFAGHDARCWPSNDTVLQMLPEGTDRRNFMRAKKELEDAGLLQVARRRAENGRSASCLYTLMQSNGEPGGGGATATGEGGAQATLEGGAQATRSKSEGSRARSVEQNSRANLAIAHYHDRWKELYGKKLPWGQKESGQVARLVREYGVPEVIRLEDLWFDGRDPFAVKTAHGVGAFVTSLPRLVAAGANGEPPELDFAEPTVGMGFFPS